MSPAEAARLFLQTLAAFYTDAAADGTYASGEARREHRGAVGSLTFSKDHALDLDFVAAATNLRAHVFAIPLQSRWDVKSIAGNIIPAIATTNAIVAGLEVLEAIKILRGDDIASACRRTGIARVPQRHGGVLAAEAPTAPNKGCFVCGTAGVTVYLDTHAMTLRAFVDRVLVGALAFNSPNIDNNDGFVFNEEREDGEDENEFQERLAYLQVPLANLVGGGLRDGTVATICDFGQGDLTLNLTVCHRDAAAFDEKTHPGFFELVGADNLPAPAPIALAASAPAPSASAETASGSSKMDVAIEIVDDDVAAPADAAAGIAPPSAAIGTKRSLEDASEEAPSTAAAKRARTGDRDAEEVMLIDSDSE
jgi:ubiquitin-like 1-activating enzyme E1 B